jgi:thiol-disulfide isomerase/thioredoxin
MKKLIHTLCILTLLFSCAQKNQYIINGSLSEKGTGDWIYLLHPGNINSSIVDSAHIINEKFQFKGNIDLPELYFLSYQIDDFFEDLPIFLEQGKFIIKLDIQDFKLGSIFDGGRLNNEYQNFLNLANKNSSALRFEKTFSEENYLEDYMSFVKAMEEEKNRSLDYVRNNPDSPISVYLLTQNKYELSLEDMGELIGNFGESVRHMNLFKMMKSEYDNQMALMHHTPAYELDDGGMKQFDIDFSNSTILHTLINQNPGKVMYIDVWGTWCGPCKAAFPKLKELRRDVESDDLIFVYLCAKSLKEEWEKTIANEQLIGQHYLLGDRQYKRLCGQLGRAGYLSFPTYIIINKEGKVCRKAPRPHLQKAEELLKILVSNPA